MHSRWSSSSIVAITFPMVVIPHPRVDVDSYLLPLRGRDNPKQNYIKYFFFHYATYATLSVTRVVTGFVESVYHATYPATTMPNTYATTR
ncbi:hypothetical protein QEU25_004803 [Escherichia coli]|nr:hypothetical protein [Escherichia coli]